MGLKKLWKRSDLRKRWHNCRYYNDYRRVRVFLRRHGGGQIGLLLPGRLWLDSISVVITTKCNLRCPDCSNLMQYYDSPYHLDRDLVISSMEKLNESFDWCDHYKVLGGETFLSPDLKILLEHVPREKCGKASIFTNATIVPDDLDLLEVMRRKRINVIISNYGTAQETQERLVKVLERENISYEIAQSGTWVDYGPVTNHGTDDAELRRQFIRCFINCKFLLNGCLYYCPRSGHGYDLGIIERKSDDYVDVLHNTKAQNRRRIRRLMWRHKPVEACKYCLRGTDKAVNIPRGK